VDETFAPTNYVVSIGNTGCSAPWGCSPGAKEHDPGAAPDGALYVASRTAVRQITDGTSNTAAISECLIGSPWIVDTTGNTGLADQILAGSTPNIDKSNGYGSRGHYWLFALRNQEFSFTTRIPPNDPLTSNHEPQIFTLYGYFAARSHHPGGVHVTFLDGSTRYINDSIDILTWRAMGSRDSGDLL
jgi:prepilin-type processing-associated H-X9-DG protein